MGYSGWQIGNGAGKFGASIMNIVYKATGSKILGFVVGLVSGFSVAIAITALVFWLVFRNEKF